MFDPTDETLKNQGLTRVKYNSLDSIGKKLIVDRADKINLIVKITHAAKLLSAMIEEDPAIKGKIVSLLKGGEEELAEKVRDILNAYLNSQSNVEIRQYYLRKTHEKSSTELDIPVQGAIREQKIEKPVQVETIIDNPPPKFGKPPIKPETTLIHKNRGERKHDIVLGLAKKQGETDEKSILAAEADLIDSIIQVTDEMRHIGVTDESIINAIWKLMEEDTSIEFPMEALMKAHRERLLELAKK